MKSVRFVFLVCALVALSLGYIDALSKEEKEKICDALLPHVLECSKEFGITEDEIKEAKESDKLDSINPCLMACVYKKIDVINDKGLFEAEKASELTQKYLSDADDQKKVADIIESCSSVNDQDVSDGEKGCDRAKLLFDCLLPLKVEFLKV